MLRKPCRVGVVPSSRSCYQQAEDRRGWGCIEIEPMIQVCKEAEGPCRLGLGLWVTGVRSRVCTLGPSLQTENGDSAAALGRNSCGWGEAAG